MFAFLLVGTLLAQSAGGAPDQATQQTDLAPRVSALLEERCADCHGPNSEKRKALRKWSKAHDLAATANNPKLVVPGAPNDSELFLAVDFDDMPPEDSDSAPLTALEKQLISDWISAGATLPVQEPAPAVGSASELTPGPTPGSISEPATPGTANPSQLPKSGPGLAPAPPPAPPQKSWMQKRLFRWLGHFHPIVVHFPIALLSVAILAELIVVLLRRKGLRETADFCLLIGFLAGVPAAAMGWFLAADTSHRGGDLDLHRWLGTSIPVLCLLAFILMRKNPKLRIPCFAVLAAVVGLTGHLGGGLTFGTDWLDW